MSSGREARAPPEGKEAVSAFGSVRKTSAEGAARAGQCRPGPSRGHARSRWTPTAAAEGVSAVVL